MLLTIRMAQSVTEATTSDDENMIPLFTHGVKKEPSPETCPLISIGTSWHVGQDTHAMACTYTQKLTPQKNVWF